MKRLAITGSSGYLGSRLVEYFRQHHEGTKILGLDVRPPERTGPDVFVQMDVRNPQLGEAIRDFRPDTVIHAAFAFAPMRDERQMREINVEGSRNLLRIVAEQRPERLLVVSSATAYGAWPDNPVPMDETWPLRARKEFRYAADKTELEALVAAFAGEHQDIATSWVRPCMIGGPHMENYLKRFIFGLPFLVLIDGYNAPLQFVHEEDVAAAIDAILTENAQGAFNVAPPDWITISDLARETGRRVLKCPFWLVYGVHWLAWTIHFLNHESPASFLYFVRYPWVIDSTRLQRELGYQFRFSSLDTVRRTVGSEGLVQGQQPPARSADR
ncbi:MAG: NAD-dependent epimerase/dehydratase family protein [Planctomycetaceae bacterium]|nr:NAD-dependent epimerase/dehydratase family protein [Planctomycetaceae bacterium]